jgi:tripeptidyl-peptidase-1
MDQFLNVGVVQQETQSFALNVESDLDLEYAMALTYPTNIMLLQTGSLAEGLGLKNCDENLLLILPLSL